MSAPRPPVDYDALASYQFDLPETLIAAMPAERRGDARMLVVDPQRQTWTDLTIDALESYLRPGDLLVTNDARVTPCRIAARRQSGGMVEVFVLGLGAEGRFADPQAPLVAMTRSSKRLQVGEVLAVPDAPNATLRVLGRGDDGLAHLRLESSNTADAPLDVLLWLDAVGRMPLPPYILKRRRDLGLLEEQALDAERYQTIFARRPGAVAAPTAGLHLDAARMARLTQMGVAHTSVTLWVGAGTFRPVTAERLSAHEMHEEYWEIDEAAAAAIETARANGGRIVAVGTTVVRTLESAAALGPIQAGGGATRLLIQPGFRFRVVDALLTNFHLPGSTLLALVAAFAGHGLTLRAYAHAVASAYRFFSYGDAMFFPTRCEADSLPPDGTAKESQP